MTGSPFDEPKTSDQIVDLSLKDLSSQSSKSERTNLETKTETEFISNRYNELNVAERLELSFHGRNSGLWERDIITDNCWFSDQFFSMLGYQPGDIAGNFESWKKLLHPADKEPTLIGIQRHLQSSEPYRIHYRLKTKSNGYRWYEAIGFAYKNEFGLPVKLTGSITDIHDVKVEEIARQRVYEVQVSDQMKPEQKIVELLQIGIDLFKVESAFVAKARSRYREIMYVAGSSIIGEVGEKFETNNQIEKLRPTERDVLIVDDIENLELHPLRNCNLHHKIKDYIGVPFSVNGKKFGFVSFLGCKKRSRGYSSRETVFAKTLSQCISYELGRQAYIDELRASNAELERFAYVASHDLQEPLRKISTCCGMLKEQLSDNLNEDAQQLLDITRDSAKRMRNLIADILELSSIDRYEERLTNVNLSDCINNIISDLGPLIENKGAAIEVGELPVIKANPSHLTILFQNLITNGLKFNKSHKPKVQLECDEYDGVYRISVSDNGIGIDPEHRTKVFEIFKRLHNRNSYPGNGIGLAIARKIVDLYGGTIKVASAQNAEALGTTVIVALPIVPNNSI